MAESESASIRSLSGRLEQAARSPSKARSPTEKQHELAPSTTLRPCSSNR